MTKPLPFQDGDGVGEPVRNNKTSDKKQKKEKAESAVTRLEAVYDGCFKERWPDVKPWRGTSVPRDRKHLKSMVSELGEAAVADLIQKFFKSRDPRITRTNYSLWAFISNAQYLQIADSAPTNGRTAANMQAAARVIGRIK